MEDGDRGRKKRGGRETNSYPVKSEAYTRKTKGRDSSTRIRLPRLQGYRPVYLFRLQENTFSYLTVGRSIPRFI
jgi:hypothetical protein